MKFRLSQLSAAITVAAVIFSSCNKQADYPLPPSLDATSTVVASATAVNAGSAKTVVYPNNTSTRLFGSGQGEVQWTQIAGAPATIETPIRDTTLVSGLKPGIYTFVLTINDKSGTLSKDTTSISVLEKMTWTIEGVTREALVHPSVGSGPAPVIFAFHGHGGGDLGFANKYFELQWSNAIVVYPQGLQTKSGADPYAKQSGWQHSVGEVNTITGVKDQDLKFFDAMLSTLETNYSVNPAFVFVHGWSNGGEFAYNVLWSTRSDKIAAFSTAAATLNSVNGKKPLPVMHIAGTTDLVVSFSKQQQTAQNVRTLDQCSSNGTEWASGDNGLLGTNFSSPIKARTVFLQYNGGHSYPDNVPPLIVKFFKQVMWRANH
jgi:polyhydroxybutyrate depolymerase